MGRTEAQRTRRGVGRVMDVECGVWRGRQGKTWAANPFPVG